MYFATVLRELCRAFRAAATTRRAPALLLSLAVLAASCSSVAGPQSSPASSSDAVDDSDTSSETEPVASTTGASADDGQYIEPGFDYSWRQLPIGGGGWVTGIAIHPVEADLVVARTDGGGAFSWDAPTGRWTQLFFESTFPDGDSADYNVASVALAPTNPDVIVLAVGDDQHVPEGEVASEGRILRSDDRGRSWSASTDRFHIAGNGEHRQRTERLAIDPDDDQHVLFGTARDGLQRSRDGGITWEQIDTAAVPVGVTPRPETHPAGVTFVTFDDRDATTVFAGVAGTGVFRSDDAAASWRQISSIDDASIIPKDGAIVAGTLVVGHHHLDDTPSTLELYDIDGDSWTDITPPQRQNVWAAAIDPTDPDRIVAVSEGVRDEFLWRSADRGASWETLDVDTTSEEIPWLEWSNADGWLSVGRIAFDPHQPGKLWFAEGLGVWIVEDSASPERLTFESRSLGIEMTVAVDLLALEGRPPVSAIADRQGFVHTDLERYPGRTLVDDQFVGSGDLAYSGQNPDVLVWVGAEYHIYWLDNRRSRAARSFDGGLSWEPLPNLDLDQFGGNVAVSATDPDNIVWLSSYLLSPWEFTDLPRGIWSTKDAGEQWNRIDDIDGSRRFHRLYWWLGRQALAADKVEGATFYLYDDEEHFYVSTDGADSWQLAAHSPPCLETSECHVWGQLRSHPSVASELWASTGTNGLWWTSDAGATPWRQIEGVDEARAFDFGAPIGDSTSLTIFLYGRVDGDDELGVWRSTDRGDSWELISRAPNGYFKNITQISGDLDDPGRVYVGFSGLGFVYGDDPELDE